ncbi:RHS repeat-associated core domain-containing protein [Flavobacterium azooxidireducens]|uniref:RHS repeat-associated core domain-containing protein n=1 Tax=Flavobacterium azooxidireducens TaxID=1871076 RepID=A0ABY4KJA8_9FLAO|nr:RHS repeat-associated core domain-containing protein [Flavobacterium azooxidireducens]UPQ80460.1 RHS repeat-associated core domain-containing protein [Flavobacterium azooxidireducens]
MKHIQQINNGTPQLIAHNSYDELGNLMVKRIGGTDVSAATPLQKIDYKYNIRGWLLSINDGANLQQVTDPMDLFAFKINYNTVENDVNGSIKPLYNGNIAETFWKTANDNHLRSYSYNYDDLNRLNEALFHKNDVLVHAYNEKITEYDKNGNIKGLQRNSSLEDELDTIEIDDLTYEYRENTNQLIKLTDDSTPTNNGGFVDGANLAIEYEYDDFGNMTKDHNKGITEIVYNHLNLPTKITFANSGQIVYVYNALGVKTEKIVTQGSTETTTKYMAGGYQYENNVLKFFPHAEGYVIKEGTSTYKHVFNYTDHLGNIRLKYCDLNLNGTIESNEILEENHYYPFGMKHERYNEDSSALANKYKYNGKEWQDELGLNMYDYHARNYDPAIGRWMNIDPLAENSRRWTPYNYAYNNPIYFIDPDGMQAGAAKGLNYNWKTGRLSYGTDIDNAGYEDDGNGGENDSGGEKGKKSKSPSSIIGGSFGSWSKSDKEWFKNNPNEAIVIKAAAAKAGAKELFSNGTTQNNGGYGDALRHTYWMYLITKELGPEIARQFGIHHENQLFRNSEGIQVNNLDSPWGRMDLHNNEWGINFALKNLSLDFEKSFQYYFDNAVMNNEIIILNQNTIPNITKKRENYEKAKQWALRYGPRE